MNLQCPLDGTSLIVAERHGIEIDYCPRCHGVWLDRGELDKIIQQASQHDDSDGNDDDDDEHGYREGRTLRSDDSPHHHDRHHGDRPGSQRHKKRGGFLGDLFDGFGD